MRSPLGSAVAALILVGTSAACAREQSSTEPRRDSNADCATAPIAAYTLETGIGGGVYRLAVVRPEEDPVLLFRDLVVHSPSISPDGKRVAVVYAHGDYESGGPDYEELWIIDIADMTVDVVEVHDGAPFFSSPDWSLDGSTIAFVHGQVGDRAIRLYDVGTGSSTQLALTPGFEGSLAWSPDGSRLAFIANEKGEGGARRWFVEVLRRDGKRLHRIDIATRAVGLAWHPDGETVLVAVPNEYEGTQVTLVNVEFESARVEPITDNDRYLAAAWSLGKRSWALRVDEDGAALVRVDLERPMAESDAIDLNIEGHWPADPGGRMFSLGPCA